MSSIQQFENEFIEECNKLCILCKNLNTIDVDGYLEIKDNLLDFKYYIITKYSRHQSSFKNLDLVVIYNHLKNDSWIKQTLSCSKQFVAMMNLMDKPIKKASNHYPHKCLRCGSASFNSFFSSDCSAKCS